ncbi:MAG: GNAT family N-acetyltransferase [Gammaproteobacteria bacterium]|nr:GNAT family N-acetyltransferase [Gammaproteobacteria bacterium]
MLDHPLGDSCFVGPLISHFAAGRDFLAVRSAGTEHQSMLLLRSRRFGLVESFCPAQTEICPVLITTVDELQALFNKLPFFTQALQLYCQDPDYSVFPSASSAVICEVDHHVYTVCIDLDGDFTSYWQSRPVKLQKNIDRSMRAMAKASSNWRFATIESPEAVELAVERYGDLEIQGWKRAAGTAVHRTNSQGQFYQEVLRRFAERGKGLVYELYFDDSLIGSQLAIGNDSMLITLKTTYNEAFREYSPGKILDYLILQQEFELGRFSKVEFCTNAGPELMRWGNRTRSISHLTVYRNKFSQRLVQFYRKLKGLQASILRIFGGNSR